jgi:hypothetical protein
MNAQTIVKTVLAVTKKWTRQRKAEDRGRSRTSRRQAMVSRDRVYVKDAAWDALPEAYLRASDNGRLPVAARQIYYAVRPLVLEATGKSELKSGYFTQTLLPDFIAAHPEITASWDVVNDARGHFSEPHTEKVIGLGTLDVRAYLGDVSTHVVESVDFLFSDADDAYPTCGPGHRFGAVLFIEKEGFLPLFEAVKLAERYDLAIMSTKGQSVVACRHLADELCGRYEIPLLVLHDFDQVGMSILGTLQGLEKWDKNYNEITPRYQFRRDFEVIDLGLRLADVESCGLPSESVAYKHDPRHNLEQNGASEEEIAFLAEGSSWGAWYGQRVELNVFTSRDFIVWLERKLNIHGIKKVVPDAETLEVAYRRLVQLELVKKHLPGLVDEAARLAKHTAVPKGLQRKVATTLKRSPTLPWDAAVAEVVKNASIKKDELAS